MDHFYLRPSQWAKKPTFCLNWPNLVLKIVNLTNKVFISVNKDNLKSSPEKPEIKDKCGFIGFNIPRDKMSKFL